MKYTMAYWEDVDRAIWNIPDVEKLYGTRLLITGATGMICSCIAEILFWLNQKYNAGIEVIMAGRNKEKFQKRFSGIMKEWNYGYIFYDAVKPMEIEAKVDFVIHGAGNASPSVYEEQPVETILGHVVGLNTLLNLLKSNGRGRLLYISSSEVYGNKDGVSTYKEDDYGSIDILNMRACYPNAKRLAETLCVAYSCESGVDTVIARPGHIYGPSITEADSRATAQFTRAAILGRDIVMKSSGLQKRSYCYTLDCASAILTILLKGEKAEAYNISNCDSVVTIRQWAETLADYASVKIVFEEPSDKEMKGYNMMNHSALNAGKLEKLGWKAEFDLLEGVKKTVDFMKN